MSIDYSTLFTRAGKSVREINIWRAEQATMLADATTIVGEYSARPDLIAGYYTRFSQNTNSVASWIATPKSLIDLTINDLQEALSAPNGQITTVLPLLIKQMGVDAQSVTANVISAPSITPNGGNIGNGVLVASANSVAGSADQRGINENILLTCTADQSTVTAGSETFQVVGQPPSSPSSYAAPGSGTSQIRVSDSQNKLTNGSFATFTGAVPNGWTIVAGGTQISQETVNVHAGTGALKLTGNGTVTTVTLTQSLVGKAKANTIYALGGWIRKSGTVTTGSTLAITVSGTGASTQTLYSADPNGLTTSYALSHLFWVTPGVIPSDYRVQISWTAANTAGASAVLLVDNVVVAQPLSFGYVQYALFRGSADFLRNDSIAVVTANNNAGVFQTYFCSFYGLALPTSGSPTISDSLAT